MIYLRPLTAVHTSSHVIPTKWRSHCDHILWRHFTLCIGRIWTKSSAAAEGPRDALCQSKSRQLLHNCRNKLYNQSNQWSWGRRACVQPRRVDLRIGVINDLDVDDFFDDTIRGVVGRGREGMASLTPSLFLTEIRAKLVHCCNWLLTETQCKIISVHHECRPKMFKNLRLSLVSGLHPWTRSTCRGEIPKSRVWDKMPEGSAFYPSFLVTQLGTGRRKLPCQKPLRYVQPIRCGMQSAKFFFCWWKNNW